MPVWLGLLPTVLLLAAFSVVRRHEPPAWQVVTGPAFALLVLLATFAVTTAAGVLFALLREVSGGLLAPFVLHWAINGLGVLAQVLALRWSRADAD